MASVADYVVSKGFNKNIFLEENEDIDISKIGMGFFPGNEILNPQEKEANLHSNTSLPTGEGLSNDVEPPDWNGPGGSI